MRQAVHVNASQVGQDRQVRQVGLSMSERLVNLKIKSGSKDLCLGSNRQKDRKTERQKDRKTERQKDRKTERQKDRKTESAKCRTFHCYED
jgi:hypothetical protein